MAADRPLPADVSEAIHAFAEAHRAAAVVPEDASIREHRAAIVTCDEAYCTLVERIGSALRASRAAAPARDPEPAEVEIECTCIAPHPACPNCNGTGKVTP